MGDASEPVDSTATIRRLEESNSLREPLLRSIIRALQLPAGSYGLDIGCGTGRQAILLAQAVSGEGRVVGLDISRAILNRAVENALEAGLANCVSFREEDMNNLPFEERTFDWVWSADCVGYPAGDAMPALREIRRVSKPGATIAILGWTAQQLLPGYPTVEARLNAACSAYTPYLRDKPPQEHFMRLPEHLRELGTEGIECRTFVADIQAPLSVPIRRAMTSLFEMLWGEPQADETEQDRDAYYRLCDPHSPAFVLDLPDYYGFFTYTLFRAAVPR